MSRMFQKLLPNGSGGQMLAEIYGRAAQQTAAERCPVIVIPGVLGSRLCAPGGLNVWGDFSKQFIDPKTPEGAQLIAMPMEPEARLCDIDTPVYPDGTLTTVRGRMLGLPVELSAYREIVLTLGAGGYQSDSMFEDSILDYGPSALLTCFQFDYDWRRSIVDNAIRLGDFVEKVIDYAHKESGCPEAGKVDIVAHSMGGLILRYYLRYGKHRLNDDGSAPNLNWEGAKNVEHAVMIGTPNAGSLFALEKLISGLPKSALTPYYDPVILGSMPAVYELLPRSRHGAFVDPRTGEPPEDLYDPELWHAMRWGLAGNHDDDSLGRILLSRTAGARQEIANEHLEKCLANARNVHLALDAPASPPSDLTKCLFAGDAKATPSVMTVDRAKVQYLAHAPGDGTVLRSSALMDERVGNEWQPRIITPIEWSQITLLHADHMGLTKNTEFTDNILYLLLEKPRNRCQHSL